MQYIAVQQRCTRTGFWIFWIQIPAASNRISSGVFFPVTGPDWIWISCLLKDVAGCLLDLYLPGLKQESDCLCLVGAGSGLDSDSKFAKQDWIWTQKIRVRTPLLHSLCWQILWQSMNQTTFSSSVPNWFELVSSRLWYSGFESNMLVSIGVVTLSTFRCCFATDTAMHTRLELLTFARINHANFDWT